MSKHVIFLVFIFCATFLRAHPILEGLEKSYQSKKYSDLLTYLEGLDNISTVEINYESGFLIEREIIDNYYELKIEIEQNNRNEEEIGVYTVDRYFVNLIRFEQRIIHFKIVEEVYTKNKSDEWVQSFELIKEKTDSLEYKKLETAYLNIYNADLKYTALFEDKIVYGDHCGIAGQTPPYREQLNYFVQNKSEKFLHNWLVSATPELQLYAIDGILTLSKSGLRFKDDTYALIEIIANKEGSVNSCSGCMYGQTTIQSEVSNLLKKHGLTDIKPIRKANFSIDAK